MARPEIFEHHAVRQHRMGANHQPGTAIRNGGKGHPLFGGFHATHQQGNVDAKRLQAVGQVGGVLAGQNFRWGQHGALPAILRGKPDGCSGHQRFAAAYIALQQTIHRGLATQIMADFFRRAALCPGGCIGQAAPEWRKVQLPHGGTGNFAAMASHQKYAQLQDIQFFKDQTAAAAAASAASRGAWMARTASALGGMR